jgi:hypothetical protein
VQYEETPKLGRNDKLVQLSSNPHTTKLWSTLPDTIVVRLVSYKIKGKQYDILTSIVDLIYFPSRDIADLYGYR